MFRESKRHLQPVLISNVNDLPAKQKKRLEDSWAGTFFREVYARLPETMFADLYSDIPSRPNVPVRLLVSLEFLKQNRGWSDEELYDEYAFDLQVRYSVGVHQLGEADFDLRTLYYFRERLSRFAQETGRDLITEAFEQITDGQAKAVNIRLGKQRMDSTLISSNIRRMSRLQLLVEVLQRVHRMLSKDDQQKWEKDFATYLEGSSGKFVYRVKGKDVAEYLQAVGVLMIRLLNRLKEKYGKEPAYCVLLRVFAEHFREGRKRIVVKGNEELSAQSLQSPDDLEATYREKGGRGHQGYAANVTETCDPKNDVQLITKVQVAPNTTDDSQLLAEAAPSLKERTGVEEMNVDGAYGGPAADKVLREEEIRLRPTGIRGREPDSERLHLADFSVYRNRAQEVSCLRCAQGQRGEVRQIGRGERYAAEFARAACKGCSLLDKCKVVWGTREEKYRFTFTQEDAEAAERRRSYQQTSHAKRNLRAAVEATVRCIKLPFRRGKAPVRGIGRMTQVMVASAVMINARRIHRFEESSRKELEARRRNEERGEGERNSKVIGQGGRNLASFSFLFSMFLSRLLPFRLRMAI
jgi:hypothetical protein